MGSGVGKKDVSKELEYEEQIMGLKDEEVEKDEVKIEMKIGRKSESR